GATLHVDSGHSVTKQVKAKMEAAISPEPNKRILGLYVKLWFYNITKDTKKKRGWHYFWKYKVGEPPVLLSSVNPERTAAVIENRLNTSGHFRSDVKYKVNSEKRKANVEYHAHPAAPYFIS